MRCACSNVHVPGIYRSLPKARIEGSPRGDLEDRPAESDLDNTLGHFVHAENSRLSRNSS